MNIIMSNKAITDCMPGGSRSMETGVLIDTSDELLYCTVQYKRTRNATKRHPPPEAHTVDTNEVTRRP